MSFFIIIYVCVDLETAYYWKKKCIMHLNYKKARSIWLFNNNLNTYKENLMETKKKSTITLQNSI